MHILVPFMMFHKFIKLSSLLFILFSLCSSEMNATPAFSSLIISSTLSKQWFNHFFEFFDFSYRILQLYDLYMILLIFSISLLKVSPCSYIFLLTLVSIFITIIDDHLF